MDAVIDLNAVLALLATSPYYDIHNCFHLQQMGNG